MDSDMAIGKGMIDGQDVIGWCYQVATEVIDCSKFFSWGKSKKIGPTSSQALIYTAAPLSGGLNAVYDVALKNNYNTVKGKASTVMSLMVQGGCVSLIKFES